MGLTERAFAWWYPRVAALAENAGQRETRAEVLSSARGRTLEIGAGSGYNLPHYPGAVTELVVTEPSPYLVQLLRPQLRDQAPPVGPSRLLRAGAEALPFADDSFDTVTSAFVHCTIPHPDDALREIARVLRPGGRYLFLEHVRSPDSRLLGTVQDVLERPHVWFAAGCHPNRRFEQVLADSPLHLEDLRRGRQPRSSPTVRPTVRGIALAPA
jgi:ubiquinone/menaquinone biosynthesis C-methylase UbiE